MCDRPHAKVTPNSANRLFTQFKAPYASSECKILIMYLNHWHLLEIRHSGGLCGARCICCTHFGRERVHFWTCTDRPLLQEASIIYFILQCCNVKFGTGVLGKPASGRHLHKGHRGKWQKDMLLHTCCKFQPGFCSQSCGLRFYLYKNLHGQLVAWFKFGGIVWLATCSNFFLCYFGSIWNSQIHTRVAG